MARSYNRLRETTFDLYVERDSLPGYFRFITLSSTWLIFIGYLLFALSFSVADDELNASRNLLIALASALLIVGYITSAIVAFFSRSLMFLIDSALYPILTSSVMGILVTALTYGLHKTQPVPRVYMAVPLVTSCATTAIAAIVLALVYKEINRIKVRDERRRWHVALGPYSQEAQPIQPHNRSISGVEDDAQRRQLMRLLQERHEQPSLENMRGTYKIDLPGEHQRTPTALAWSARQPSTKQRFRFSDLLPWTNSASGTFKDARERRREEIERSGMHGFTTSPNLGWHQRSASDPSDTTNSGNFQPLPVQSQPSWGWPPATRYA